MPAGDPRDSLVLPPSTFRTIHSQKGIEEGLLVDEGNVEDGMGDVEVEDGREEKKRTCR